MLDYLDLGACLVICFLSGIPHEIAHATMAFHCGDSTAARQGRLSWDPRVHFDWLWTFLIPALMLLSSGGRFVFGGPKPVPVTPWYLHNPKRDLMLVSIAGPLTNLAIVVLFTLLAAIPGFVREDSVNQWIFSRIVLVNLALFCFNILPIPPLDGFGFVQGLLPKQMEGVTESLRNAGMMVLFIAMYLGLTRILMMPMLNHFLGWIDWISPSLFPHLLR